MKSATAAVTVALSVLALAGCAQQPEPLQRYYHQHLSFGTCDGYATTSGDEEAFASSPDLRCARMEVPLDYQNPDGRTARIALLKVPARGEKLGSLVLNPGGPAAPG